MIYNLHIHINSMKNDNIILLYNEELYLLTIIIRNNLKFYIRKNKNNNLNLKMIPINLYT